MTSKINISNTINHILIYGYFQHAYEVWYVLQGENIQHFSPADLLAQKHVFASIKSKIRGKEFYAIPNMLNAIAMLSGNNPYPKEIQLPDTEKIFFDQIIKLRYRKLVSLYRQYCKIQNIQPDKVAYSELKNALRNGKAIDFLMKNFRQEYFRTNPKSGHVPDRIFPKSH